MRQTSGVRTRCWVTAALIVAIAGACAQPRQYHGIEGAAGTGGGVSSVGGNAAGGAPSGLAGHGGVGLEISNTGGTATGGAPNGLAGHGVGGSDSPGGASGAGPGILTGGAAGGADTLGVGGEFGSGGGLGGSSAATGGAGGSPTYCECEGPINAGQIGVRVSADSTCPTGYAGGDVLLHSGLMAGTACTGCHCSVTPTMCSVEISTYCKDNPDLSGCGTTCSEDFGVVGGDPGPILSDATDASHCASIFSTSILYSVGPLVSKGGDACQTSGAAAASPVTWAESIKFCSATSVVQSTCPTDEVCTQATAAPRCILVDGDDTCAPGYTKYGGPWKTGFQDQRACSVCSCSLTTHGDCGTRTVSVDQGGSCNNASAPTVMTNSRHCVAVNYPVFTLNGSTAQGQCDSYSTTTGSVIETGAKTLCCR
jgi:hypothetical protein